MIMKSRPNGCTFAGICLFSDYHAEKPSPTQHGVVGLEGSSPPPSGGPFALKAAHTFTTRC